MADGKIGKAWSRVAQTFVGHPEGKTCHWCEHIKLGDGEAHCGHPESKFNDGDRIRTWDGLECAEECGFFTLDEWYTDDQNIRKYFTPEAADSWLKTAQ